MWRIFTGRVVKTAFFLSRKHFEQKSICWKFYSFFHHFRFLCGDNFKLSKYLGQISKTAFLFSSYLSNEKSICWNVYTFVQFLQFEQEKFWQQQKLYPKERQNCLFRVQRNFSQIIVSLKNLQFVDQILLWADKTSFLCKIIAAELWKLHFLVSTKHSD